jgi:two-component system NtrC family sensor kinase
MGNTAMLKNPPLDTFLHRLQKKPYAALFFFNIMLDLSSVVSSICVMADNNETSKSTPQIGLLKNEAETERLAAIGKFTAKIAHELNNPLDGILRYINLACRSAEVNNTDKLNEYLNNSRQGILRMVKIVRELLEFSRCRYLPTEEPVPMEHIIEEAIKTCTGRSDTPPVQIVRDFAKETLKYPAVNLFQVFCNLIRNAFDSMPSGGVLEISTKAEMNGDIVIEFSDTGHGFNPADKDALFEPFFTTKTQGRGTGLGLAICKDLVARHGGHITAENRAEGGSVFTVYLPRPAEAIV